MYATRDGNKHGHGPACHAVPYGDNCCQGCSPESAPQQRHGAAEAIVPFFTSFLAKKCLSWIWQQSLRHSSVLPTATSSPLPGTRSREVSATSSSKAGQSESTSGSLQTCSKTSPTVQRLLLTSDCLASVEACLVLPTSNFLLLPARTFYISSHLPRVKRTSTPTPSLDCRLPFHQHPSSKNTLLPF